MKWNLAKFSAHSRSSVLTCSHLHFRITITWEKEVVLLWHECWRVIPQPDLQPSILENIARYFHWVQWLSNIFFGSSRTFRFPVKILNRPQFEKKKKGQPFWVRLSISRSGPIKSGIAWIWESYLTFWSHFSYLQILDNKNMLPCLVYKIVVTLGWVHVYGRTLKK